MSSSKKLNSDGSQSATLGISVSVQNQDGQIVDIDIKSEDFIGKSCQDDNNEQVSSASSPEGEGSVEASRPDDSGSKSDEFATRSRDYQPRIVGIDEGRPGDIYIKSRKKQLWNDKEVFSRQKDTSSKPIESPCYYLLTSNRFQNRRRSEPPLISPITSYRIRLEKDPDDDDDNDEEGMKEEGEEDEGQQEEDEDRLAFAAAGGIHDLYGFGDELSIGRRMYLSPLDALNQQGSIATGFRSHHLLPGQRRLRSNSLPMNSLLNPLVYEVGEAVGALAPSSDTIATSSPNSNLLAKKQHLPSSLHGAEGAKCQDFSKVHQIIGGSAGCGGISGGTRRSISAEQVKALEAISEETNVNAGGGGGSTLMTSRRSNQNRRYSTPNCVIETLPDATSL